MKDFILPRPEETHYDEFIDSDYNEIMQTIKAAINNDTFTITLKSNWNIYRNKDRINDEIGKFGWKIKDEWHGSKDDGDQIIKILKK